MEAAKTLRDEFAIAALTGLCAAMTGKATAADIKRGDNPFLSHSRAAYGMADAMMAARSNPVHQIEGGEG